jgi:hypothetical protein
VDKNLVVDKDAAPDGHGPSFQMPGQARGVEPGTCAAIEIPTSSSDIVGTPPVVPLHDLGVPGQEVWLAAGRRYAAALASGFPVSIAEISTVNRIEPIPHPRVHFLGIDAVNLPLLTQIFASAYHRLEPGDVVVVNAPGVTTPRRGEGVDREILASALFEGGFDCPLIWAGSKVLRAESALPFLARLLPTSALGAGPRRLCGLATSLKPPTDRIVAMARRSQSAPPAERALRLSVVMPVYNERSTFCEVIERLLSKEIAGFEVEICIVESNSTDGTRDEVLRYANHPRVRLILEDKPSGKGHAVRKGFETATGDIVLIQDADLEYDLDDYEKLLTPLREGRAGFVLGSRHAPGEKAWQLRQFSEEPAAAVLMNVGHLVFAGLLNLVFGQKLRDPFTMYKVFRRDAIHNIKFECNRFDFDIELVGKLIRLGYTPLEIDVRYSSRSFKEGKKVSPFGDPPTWIRACLKHRFSALHALPGCG